MVTWGVTGAGGRVVGSSPSEDGADSAATAPEHAGRTSGSGESCDSRDGSSHSVERAIPPLTVAPTPRGLARALSVASAALATTGPRRSHPAYRRRPPAMTVGERTVIPDRLADRASDVDVTLSLPPALSSLFVAAPLAYYLPASIRLEEDAPPGLHVEGERRAELVNPAADAGTLLRRVFYLDCAIRRGGPPSADRLGGDDVLERLGLDPFRLRAAPATERLDRYLAAWEPRFDELLPKWHLSTAVEPTPAAITSLPSLLDRLSLVELPDGEPRRRPDLLDRTLDDAYRTRGAGSDADVVAPSARVGQSQGWLAPGRPIEAFKPTNTAFQHRQRYDGAAGWGGGDGGERSVAVVLGDGSTREEYRDVASVYRERGTGASVEVVAAPTRAALRSIFRAGHDLIHYVGHCDEAGLRCTDGHLAATDVAPCRTPAFVLNACGSYDQGLALVERGAVAGAVTFADVLDDHAVRVGTALARLLVEGFSVQRATELARRRILMGQDYAAVGDGTYAPWQDRRPPGVMWIEPAPTGTEIGTETVMEPGMGTGTETDDTNDDRAVEDRSRASDDAGPADAFEVTYEVRTLRQIGACHPVPFGNGPVFNGDAVSTTLSGPELVPVLADGRYPVVWQGDLFWSADVRKRFRR